MEVVTYGQVAYQAYYDASDGKSLVSGQPLPQWDEQDQRIIRAWNRAGGAVCDEIIGDGLPGSELAMTRGLRELVREILREIELGTLGQHTPAATTKTLARTAQWRQRAGLVHEEAAITGAGTEHVAAQLLDPGNPGAWQRVADMPARER